MAISADTITQSLINQLKILDPTVSAEVGTPERKIFEAVAEMLASQQVDFTVLNQQTDISTLSGGRLDAYLSIFNFGRQQATPAYGAVTFSRNTNSTTQIIIPRGTQVQANLDSSVFPSLIFVTTDTIVMDVGTSSITTTVQCTVSGTVGNIDANTIVGFAGLQNIAGISRVSNAQAFSGGADTESDDSYKVHFQNSFMRNISGTTDMFLALAVSMNGVTKANVVGAISRYQEYIQIPAADDAAQKTDNITNNNYDSLGTLWPHKRTSAKSTIPYSQFTYPVNNYLTNGTLDPSTAKFFRPGADFVFNAPPINASVAPHQATTTPTTTPNITFLNAKSVANPTGNPDLTESGIVLLEHAYISTHSRNNYSFGILNCVDAFVNGSNLTRVSSAETVPPVGQKLQNTNAGSWTYQLPGTTNNFTRQIDSQPAAVGSLIQPLYWQPVTQLPDTITIGSDTYLSGNFVSGGIYYWDAAHQYKAHYVFIEETNANYGTIRARNGIEWFQAGSNYLNGQLATDTTTYNGTKIETHIGTTVTLDGYFYDQNVSDLQAVMEKNKQTTQDVLVHKSRVRYFQPLVTVMYSFGVTQAVVNVSVNAALANFFENQYYGSAIQLSDILQTVHNVPGVDNVRWTNPVGIAVNEVSKDGSTTLATFTTDFFIQDSELADSPNANQSVITARAQNTW